MNKKGGFWGFVTKIVLIITLLGFFFGINHIGDFFPSIDILSSNSILKIYLPPKNPFDFSQVSLDGLIPFRENLYSHSNNIVCYKFNNPNDKIDSSFILHNEWFLDNQKIPNNLTTKLNYDEIFRLTRYDWSLVGDNSTVRFRTGLEFNKKPLFGEIEYDLIKNEELIDYLKKEEGKIVWDHDLIKELINGTSLCGLSDELQTNITLSFVRENMNLPLETIKKIEYDNRTESSEISWNEKIGTSSEYSYVFVSLLRSIGIPSKIETTKFEDYDYYYVKVYLKDKGWVPIDVYDNGDESKKLGEYFVLDKFKKDVDYKDIIIPELSDYVVFDTVLTYRRDDGKPHLSYTITNKFGKDMESFCIKVFIDYYDTENNLLYSNEEYKYLLHFEGLKQNETGFKEEGFYGVDFNEDFDYMTIRLKEFSDSCK